MESLIPLVPKNTVDVGIVPVRQDHRKTDERILPVDPIALPDQTQKAGIHPPSYVGGHRLRQGIIHFGVVPEVRPRRTQADGGELNAYVPCSDSLGCYAVVRALL